MPPQQCLDEDQNNQSLLSETLLSSDDHDDDQNNNNNNNVRSREDETIERGHVPPRNVTFILLYTWVAFTGRGLWNQNCLATLVYLLRNGDPKAIGYITAAMGISQLCASIPTGILADKYRRDTLLKIGAVFGIFAAAASIVAALRPHYLLLVVALVLWGIHWGIVNTSITALFSDSIPDGERSFYFTRRAILINFANMCGPAIALVMFAVMGDTWTVRDCSMVLLAGNVLSLPGILLLCLMSDSRDANDDDNTISDELSIAYPCETPPPPPPPPTPTTNTNELEVPLLSSDGVVETNTGREDTMGSSSSLRRRRRRLTSGRSSSNNTITTAITHRDETYDEERLGQALYCLPRKRIVPILVATSDIISGLASGMSIRYFAIFLYDNLNLSPVAVQVIYIINPILQVGLRRQAQRLAGTYGRCRVTVCLKWIGILLMVSMVISYKLELPRSFVCVILILRTTFMNSPAPLTKSVLMDHVPKEERAKWASLESVNMVSWSGSAALGGILVESHGILFNFCFTAGLQLIATGPLFFLSFFDQKEDDEEEDDDTRTATTLNQTGENRDGDDDNDDVEEE